MKLMFVSSTLRFSGAEKIMSHLINELHGLYEISILFTGQTESDERFGSIPQYSAFFNKRGIINVVKRRLQMRSIFKMSSPDYIISFNTNNNIDTIYSSMFLKNKVVICERNDPNNYPASRIRRLRRNIAYNLADICVFQTEEIKLYFNKRIQKRSFIIPNFIVNNYENNSVNTTRRPVIGMFTRLDDRQKDITTAIKGFAEFSKRNSLYYMEIYGDGKDRIKLQNLVVEMKLETRIIFKGKVENSLEIMSNIDMFLITSRFEGMPNGLMEAMSIGLPCISSNFSGGASQVLINHGYNGLIFEVGKHSQLAEYMMLLSNNNTIKDKIALQATKINHSYDIKKILPLWINLFKQGD